MRSVGRVRGPVARIYFFGGLIINNKWDPMGMIYFSGGLNNK